jgi:pSer/pThr/pTyr-binding forkhead associated (FHA) protein
MATVVEHLRQIADALAHGRDADLGCPALVESWISAGSEDLHDPAFSTGVEVDAEEVAAFAKEQLDDVNKSAWKYVEGALQGDYAALEPLLRQIPPHAEVRLLKKSGANTVEKICIGRGKRNDVIILDEAVSTIHAQIDCLDDDTAILVDRRSSNGTFVNHERLEPNKPVKIASGDLVGLGQHLLYYLGRDSLRVFLKLRLAAALQAHPAPG